MKAGIMKLWSIVFVAVALICAVSFFMGQREQSGEAAEELSEDEVLVETGKSYAENGEYELAMKSFDNAIIINPKNTKAYSSKAYVCFAQNEYEDGVTELEAGCEATDDAELAELLEEIRALEGETIDPAGEAMAILQQSEPNMLEKIEEFGSLDFMRGDMDDWSVERVQSSYDELMSFLRGIVDRFMPGWESFRS